MMDFVSLFFSFFHSFQFVLSFMRISCPILHTSAILLKSKWQFCRFHKGWWEEMMLGCWNETQRIDFIDICGYFFLFVLLFVYVWWKRAPAIYPLIRLAWKRVEFWERLEGNCVYDAYYICPRSRLWYLHIRNEKKIPIIVCKRMNANVIK